MHVGLASSKPIPVQLDRFVTDGLIESMAKRFPVVSARKQVQTLSSPRMLLYGGFSQSNCFPLAPSEAKSTLFP